VLCLPRLQEIPDQKGSRNAAHGCEVDKVPVTEVQLSRGRTGGVEENPTGAEEGEPLAGVEAVERVGCHGDPGLPHRHLIYIE